jgi:hypothetical protein
MSWQHRHVLTCCCAVVLDVLCRRGPSPPNPDPPNGLSRETITPPPLLDEVTDRLSQMNMSPSQMQQQHQKHLKGPGGAMQGNMSAMIAAQMVQQGQVPAQLLQQLSPGMLSNTQLMMQAQQQQQQQLGQQQLQQQMQMQQTQVIVRLETFPANVRR